MKVCFFTNHYLKILAVWLINALMNHWLCHSQCSKPPTVLHDCQWQEVQALSTAAILTLKCKVNRGVINVIIKHVFRLKQTESRMLLFCQQAPWNGSYVLTVSFFTLNVVWCNITDVNKTAKVSWMCLCKRKRELTHSPDTAQVICTGRPIFCQQCIIIMPWFAGKLYNQ